MPRMKRAARRKKARWPNLGGKLKHWVKSQRQTGALVLTKIFIDQGRRIAQEIKKSKGEGQETTDFRGMPIYCFRFMKRNGLSLKTRTKLAQKMPDAYEEKILKFHSYIINLHKNTNFELCHIANMDEFPLTFDVPSNKTESKQWPSRQVDMRRLITQLSGILF
ncbi:Hypothetical predicted protein [Octopus vulgaris]|uniref:Uncharacterized protein n=1 Tax=Octopus vulgaris TaxID=6645 RepID=A0AA36B1F0_OCTVU|nr:Hypothetical predicted protein [Octopus vulgaris]